MIGICMHHVVNEETEEEEKRLEKNEGKGLV